MPSPFHFVVRFEPPPEVVPEFRQELFRTLAATRGESGCRSIRALESVRPPIAFAVVSEWDDEAAFELHAQLPHTVRFVAAAERLLGIPVKGLRAREIGAAQEPPEP
jgi:quinol monooxygenase YgiN